MEPRQRYNGTKRRLILAFDIGTTFSGVSYCVLDPGKVPEVRGVTRFPGQDIAGGSKIPTILYYDKEGRLRAIGAEAAKQNFEEMLEEGWTKTEWFKLHLRPKSLFAPDVVIPPLPEGKTVTDLFADFMKYLFESTRDYIQERHPDGINLWDAVKNDIHFILTHPNGWEGGQQTEMRRAAIQAGFVPDLKEGQSRIQFVTEGEASLHFCVREGLTARTNETNFLIVDAGGGTIDLSAYSQDTSIKKLSFQESATAQCHLTGSIYVTRRAQAFLDDFLKGSKFHDDVDNIADCFDKTSKLRFRNSNEPEYIKFGSRRDTDRGLGIRFGQLKLSGTVVASFFTPSLNCLMDAILQMRQVASGPTISSVSMVGGFSESDWLFSQVKSRLADMGIDVHRPNAHANKAAADGAIFYYIDHFVTSRVAKYTYGVGVCTGYDSTDGEHMDRSSDIFLDLGGSFCVHGAFDTILPKAS